PISLAERRDPGGADLHGVVLVTAGVLVALCRPGRVLFRCRAFARRPLLLRCRAKVAPPAPGRQWSAAPPAAVPGAWRPRRAADGDASDPGASASIAAARAPMPATVSRQYLLALQLRGDAAVAGTRS